jgi:hypothetical protein
LNIKKKKEEKMGKEKKKKWIIFDKNNGLILNGFFSFPFLHTTNSKVQALFGFNFKRSFMQKSIFNNHKIIK